MTDDPFNLQRFIDAQAPVIDQVRRELGEGRKQSHWMWFIFPQLAALGQSPTSKHFGMESREEAKSYLYHPVLGPRLIECTELVNKVRSQTATEIFGTPDDMKFHSSMTLFIRADPSVPAFHDALTFYFGGQLDRATLDLLR